MRRRTDGDKPRTAARVPCHAQRHPAREDCLTKAQVEIAAGAHGSSLLAAIAGEAAPECRVSADGPVKINRLNAWRRFRHLVVGAAC